MHVRQFIERQLSVWLERNFVGGGSLIEAAHPLMTRMAGDRLTNPPPAREQRQSRKGQAPKKSVLEALVHVLHRTKLLTYPARPDFFIEIYQSLGGCITGLYRIKGNLGGQHPC